MVPMLMYNSLFTPMQNYKHYMEQISEYWGDFEIMSYMHFILFLEYMFYALNGVCYPAQETLIQPKTFIKSS